MKVTHILIGWMISNWIMAISIKFITSSYHLKYAKPMLQFIHFFDICPNKKHGETHRNNSELESRNTFNSFFCFSSPEKPYEFAPGFPIQDSLHRKNPHLHPPWQSPAGKRLQNKMSEPPEIYLKKTLHGTSSHLVWGLRNLWIETKMLFIYVYLSSS